MSRQIEVRQSHSRAEKIKVGVATVALGGMALATAGVGLNILRGRNDDTQPTHQEKVSVIFGDEANTNNGMARSLRERGATESVDELVDELNAAEPGTDNLVQQGEHVTVNIDVPNK